jgi:hypothetical protein
MLESHQATECKANGALQPGTEQAAWREDARQSQQPRDDDSAVNRYPLAITRSARERRIENWAKSSTAVIASVTNIAMA